MTVVCFWSCEVDVVSQCSPLLQEKMWRMEFCRNLIPLVGVQLVTIVTAPLGSVWTLQCGLYFQYTVLSLTKVVFEPGNSCKFKPRSFSCTCLGHGKRFYSQMYFSSAKFCKDFSNWCVCLSPAAPNLLCCFLVLGFRFFSCLTFLEPLFSSFYSLKLIEAENLF